MRFIWDIDLSNETIPHEIYIYIYVYTCIHIVLIYSRRGPSLRYYYYYYYYCYKLVSKTVYKSRTNRLHFVVEYCLKCEQTLYYIVIRCLCVGCGYTRIIIYYICIYIYIRAKLSITCEQHTSLYQSNTAVWWWRCT
jgi:hypothetical protein